VIVLLNFPCVIFACSASVALTSGFLRFDFSAKGSEEQEEETEEKRRVHVVSKLHAILRPFLLRRMKEDVEQMLPRKKEIIIYANMTEQQKRIQDHLVKNTFDVYLNEESDIGIRYSCGLTVRYLSNYITCNLIKEIL
jgi:SNF2 family DNA or RNA helicase